MANTPLILATVNITAKDINGNNIAKQYNQVTEVNLDFAKGMIRVVDVTGTYYFSLSKITSFVDTITTGINGTHVIVTS